MRLATNKDKITQNACAECTKAVYYYGSPVYLNTSTEDKIAMKKRDIIIIAAVLVVALAAAAVSFRFMYRGGPEDMVDIKINGEIYESVSLNEDKVVEIEQAGGFVNHIEIKDGVARMLDSNCGNQDCVGMGSMSAENPGLMFGFIVCLPHQVSIELRLASEEHG